MNLIPNNPCNAPNYWCTWAMQNYIYGQGQDTIDLEELEGDIGARHGATNINEDLLLGTEGWAQELYPNIRGDLFILLDDGCVSHPQFEINQGEVPLYLLQLMNQMYQIQLMT